jgi:hypothetical protein
VDVILTSGLQAIGFPKTEQVFDKYRPIRYNHPVRVSRTTEYIPRGNNPRGVR